MSFVVIVLLGRPLSAKPYQEGDAKPTATLDVIWTDSARNREVPVLIVYPRDLAHLDPAPVIIFSHGLGGSRFGYKSYGDLWASHGYVVVFPQHHGSDTGVIGHGMADMLKGIGDLQPFLDRLGDIHFVIDQLEKIQSQKIPGEAYALFAGKLDLTKIGMSGHSFGAITTQAISGQKYILDKDSHLADPRIKAAIAMSGSGSKDSDQDRAFGSIKIPVFYLTGTQDQVGNIGGAQRRTPFDHSTFPQTYLLTFTGATHMTFVPPRENGLGLLAAGKEKYQPFIQQSTCAFWDAFLRGNSQAQTWLEKELPDELGKLGVFESKAAPAK